MTDEPDAHDLIPGRRPPLDWYIEVCAICGCQLGPGIGARTRSGRCVTESHRSAGGIVVRVGARPLDQQDVVTRDALHRLRVTRPIPVSDTKENP